MKFGDEVNGVDANSRYNVPPIKKSQIAGRIDVFNLKDFLKSTFVSHNRVAFKTFPR
jgi:hypothetical protein